MKRIIILVGIICLLAFDATGQSDQKKQYKATRILVPPVINGILDDEAWKAGTWEDEFTQHEPYNGGKSSQRTEFKILFDENNLYVAFKAYDTSPDSIVNRLTRRDEADGDLVGIIVDSFHDLRTGFLFGVSSAGVKYDHIFTNDGQNEDSSWDPNWWVKTSVNKEGWIAEMKIPLSQVRFEKNSGEVWGLEMARVLYRKNETTFWQHIPKSAPGLVHLFGELTGLEQIKPRKILDVTPYGVAKAETYKVEPSNPFRSNGREYKLNGGIDAKIGVTNNMTMDLTINPDFGQVEADPSEVNLSAYETFLKEKRPFFIEGNNITNFGLGIGDGDIGNDNLFYSRRIGRRPQGNPELNDGWNASVPAFTSILSAAKLTGKTQNGLSVGFVDAVTNNEYAVIDTGGGRRLLQTVEPLTNYMVGRVQKDFKDGNTILGGIFTSTNRSLDNNLSKSMNRSAYTGGIDFTQYFLKKSWMFNLNAAFSEVNGSKKAIEITQKSSARYFQREDKKYTVLDTSRTSLAGSGGRMQLMKLNGHWNYMACVIWKTPGFETNDLGYIREADQILTLIWGQYSQWEPKGIYRRFNIQGDVYSAMNFGMDNIGRAIEANGNITLKNYWQINGGGTLSTIAYSTDMLRGGPKIKVPGTFNGHFNLSTDNRKKLVFAVHTNFSTGFEHNSKNINTTLEIRLKPSNYLLITFNPGFNKSFNELQYVKRVDTGSENRYIFGSIDRKTVSASFRVNLNFTPDLSLQYWGQPFIATGKYSDFKYITNPVADNYHDRFHIYTKDEITSDINNYYINESNPAVNQYSFGKRDFNVREFLSNLVLRWEYNPGSSVYLVWSQTRSSSISSGDLNVLNDVGDLFSRSDNTPHNVFLIKFSFRFGLK
jgi:hypothetical protein